MVVGRLGGGAHKLPEDADKLYRELAERCPTAQFWFMPTPPLLKETFGRHARFRFFQRDQIPVVEFLRQCDIFCYPVRANVHEQGPKVILEAMAAGCAVVAENRDGPRDRIVSGHTGMLCETREQMIEAVAKLARNDTLRKHMGENARIAARDMGPDAWIDEIARGAEDCVHSSPPPPPRPPLPSQRTYLAEIRGGQGLGNALAMVPAVRALATMGTVDVLLAPYSYAPLFEAEPYVNRTYRSNRTYQKYTAVVPIGYFAGAAGYDGPNVAPQERISKWEISEVEANMQRVRALGYEGDTPPYRLEAEYVSPITENGPYVVIADCARNSAEWARKRWPYYNELAERMTAAGYRVVCVGQKHDGRNWMEDYSNWTGRTDIAELAGILQRAGLVVTNDCGPGHLAICLGAPTVMLFGPTSDVKNGIVAPGVRNVRSRYACQACQPFAKRYRECEHAMCLEQLGVDAVWTACKDLLMGKP